MPPQQGGSAEYFILNLSRKLMQRGHVVTILDRKYSHADPDIEYVDGVKVIRLQSLRISLFNFTVNFILSQAVFAFHVNNYCKKAKDIDIIHVYTSVLCFLLSVINKDIRQKLVYTSIGLRRDKASPNFTDRMAITLENILVKRVRRTTIANKMIAELLVKQSGVKPENVVIVPHIIDIEKFNRDMDGTEVIQRYRMEGKTNILFVGRICFEKGVEYLVKAANIIINLSGRNNVQFIVVGPAEQFNSDKNTGSRYLTKIMRMMSDFGLQEQIRFTGAVPIDDLIKLYAACDMVVVPSLVDLDPMVPVEAMASGKPVIGTRVGTIHLRIKDGMSGFIIDPADEQQIAEKIQYLLDNPVTMKEMGAYSRRLIVEENSSENMVERMLEVFQSKA